MPTTMPRYRDDIDLRRNAVWYGVASPFNHHFIPGEGSDVAAVPGLLLS